MAEVKTCIEFVGLILMAVKKDGAEAFLLDPTAKKGPRHSATLFVPDHDGLAGEPDFVVPRPFVEDDPIMSEWAGWNLQGNVTFSGTSSPFVNRLGETLDVRHIANAPSMRERHCIPVTATITIPHGILSPSGKRSQYKFFYPPESKEPFVERDLCERITLEFVTDDEGILRFSIAAANGPTREVTIKPENLSAPIIISNESAGSPDTSDHFGAMFDAVEAKRRPRLERHRAGNLDCPDRCDVCINGKFELED